jgi:hypothetical protein
MKAKSTIRSQRQKRVPASTRAKQGGKTDIAQSGVQDRQGSRAFSTDDVILHLRQIEAENRQLTMVVDAFCEKGVLLQYAVDALNREMAALFGSPGDKP